MRRILEVEATRAACARIDRNEMEALKSEMVQLLAEDTGSKKNKRWSEAEMDCDRRLHQLVADNCGSKRLRDEIQRYNTFMQAIRQIVGNQRGAQEVALREHLAILDALIVCDMYVACGEMAKHIDQTAQSVIKVMFPSATESNQAKIE
jgi:DNA-binding GntR family transcriptional regulator